ncbi:inorganic polyphosphate/ATP-NAD kinase [Spiribacter salinus M19-40]|jgi:NAD+ kinase|uniref:NAD kinase n=2 Tax=Spiribacter salinus TaxID=1335746 RepID=R4VFI0_9GAMM|nr:NAD(+) kinase [Spiribacter salinus]MDR9413904.1 NAD(+) kinase [Spiribacter sp.]AGM41006.1 inorganic polyphosphate/ATP-NAD kinase [Spiribacter salinus M19-40]MBY5268236.1 NAD kinase [Spiribacter salinus]MDR9454943.1 NAD(+) kinase [Spiribacter sp.]TQE99393.1 MAG: NAD(+) kinase [Spiribacter salinus]
MQPFQRIAITGKPNDTAVIDTIGRLVRHLESRDRAVQIDAGMGTHLPGVPAHAPLEQLVGDIDLLIVVGGDGTLLHAARRIATNDIPVLGINRGRLGFLVDVSPDRFDEIDAVLDGSAIVDERLMLEARIVHEGEIVARSLALNEVVLQKWNTSRMIEFETWIDDEPCNRHRSDGLIIATPTGSTAYAMSGGGPVMHPGINALALVPICPHTLSNRPLVVSADSRVQVRLEQAAIEHVHVSCDSQADLGLTESGWVEIAASPHRLRLVHPPGHRYFDILRAKLRWGDTTPPC